MEFEPSEEMKREVETDKRERIKWFEEWGEEYGS